MTDSACGRYVRGCRFGSGQGRETVSDPHVLVRARPSRRLTGSLALFSAVAVIAGLGLVGPARAQSPIEGTWDNRSGHVRVENTGPRAYRGTIVRVSPANACPNLHVANPVLWHIGLSFPYWTGTRWWYDADTCTLTGWGQTRWTLSVGSTTMRVCSAPPGRGAPQIDAFGRPLADTQCDDWSLVPPPRKRTGDP